MKSTIEYLQSASEFEVKDSASVSGFSFLTISIGEN